MKKYFVLLLCSILANAAMAQLYIAPGDSVSVLPGTLFTLQEHLENNGKIYNGGALTLNGTALQQLAGIGGSIDNLIANNNAILLNDITINDALLVNAGFLFDISNHQLTNGGSVNGAGFLKGSANAQLLLNGAGASSLQFDQTSQAASNALKNITVNGSGAVVNFLNKLYVYGALLPNTGSVLLNDELVLRSGSAGTARVGPVGSSLTYGINGKFVIERYIPGNRAWRLLTAPVSAASQVKISEAWQDNAPPVTNVNDINGTNNPNPGYGTHITFGFPAVNGYDQGVNGNTSIRYLMNSGWNGVPVATNDGSTLNSGYIHDQPGYMLFVRGDRSTLLWQATSALTSPTVLRPKGKIKTGTTDHPLTASFISGPGNFRVIGNPYPSPINFHQIATNPVNAANGFADAFYLWDPNITGTNGVGGFVGMSYNAAASIAAGSPVYDRTVLTGGSSSIDNGGDIQSGAAFVINYTGPATTLRIEEANKSAGNSNTFFRPAGQMRTTLLAVNADSSISVNDGVLLSFSTLDKDAVDGHDLEKINGFAENIALQKGGSHLCIERRSVLKSRDTIFYHLGKMKQKKYILRFAFDKVECPVNTGAFLEDAFLHTITPVHLNDTTNYPFAVTAVPASADSSRFRLIFKPVNRFAFITANCVNKDVLLNWKMEDTSSLSRYQIERSAGNDSFTVVGTVPGSFNEWLDVKPPPGIYFYRVRCVNGYGVVSYSGSVKVTVLADESSVYVFPNPITGNGINLRMKTAPAGLYTARLLDNQGKCLHSSSFVHSGTSSTIVIRPNNLLSKGTYQLEVIGNNHKSKVLQVLVQKP